MVAKIMGANYDDLAKLMGADLIVLGDAVLGDVKTPKTFYAGSTTLLTGIGSLKQFFADDVIALGGDPRDCIDIKVLFDEGYLTTDQIGAYVGAVGTADFWLNQFVWWDDDFLQSVMYAIPFASKLVDILTDGAGDLTVAGDTDIAGVNRYETLTVNGGITLTLTDQPSALIVDTIANSGNIVKKLSGGASGTRGAAGTGEGGQGAGGFVVFADVLGSSGIISADGEAGENGTTTVGDGNGGDGGAGEFHRIGADVPGTGGNGAYNSILPAGDINGAGGGAWSIREGGDGGGSVLTTPVSYAALAVKVRQYAIDWVIVNVFGKAPTITVSIDVYGSGGGGGMAANTNGACGGGGGGGGEVLALCLTFNNTGTIRANAGVGGNGGTEDTRDNEGGGGGGGLVYILYVALTNAGTLQANGAAAGAGDSFDTPATAGGNGVATSQDVS